MVQFEAYHTLSDGGRMLLYQLLMAATMIPYRKERIPVLQLADLRGFKEVAEIPVIKILFVEIMTEGKNV
jgi:hypothetical protein